MYHRIATTENDPWSLCVNPRNFKDHLDVLQGHECISLGQLIGSENLPKRSVVITFDDGYLDNLTVASPLLADYDIPATFFVTTANCENGFWWDRVSGLTPAEYESVRGLPEGQREKLLSSRSNAPVCSATDLLQLAKMKDLELGAHTVSHPYLPGLEAENRRQEISECKAQLESLLGKEVEGFAYPFGAYGKSVGCVREAGFQWACSTEPDRFWSGSDPYRLPRVQVPNVGGKEFETFLKVWTE